MLSLAVSKSLPRRVMLSRQLVSLESRFFSAPASVLDDEDDAPSAKGIASLQDKFRGNAKTATMTFSSTSRMTTGLRSTSTIRDKFELKVDEPVELGGTDTAPNPVEMLLAALGGCQEITYKIYARTMDIPLHSVSMHLDGEIDLRGFLAVDSSVRPGFSKIVGEVVVETPKSVTTDEVQKLKQMVEQHCPVSDSLMAVPTTINLKHIQV